MELINVNVNNNTDEYTRAQHTCHIIVVVIFIVIVMVNYVENPLHCSCDAQKLWEWLRDHRKWSQTSAGDGINYLRCEHPVDLRGKVFAKMEPQQFCDAPLIPKIAIQDIQPYSVVVSWLSREHLGLTGYEIVYYATTDGIDYDEVSV